MNKNTAYVINVSAGIIVNQVARRVLFPKGEFQGRWFGRQLRLAGTGYMVMNIVSPVVISQVEESQRQAAAVMSGYPVAVIIYNK